MQQHNRKRTYAKVISDNVSSRAPSQLSVQKQGTDNAIQLFAEKTALKKQAPSQQAAQGQSEQNNFAN